MTMLSIGLHYTDLHTLLKFGDMVCGLRVPPIVPLSRSSYPASPSLKWVPRTRFPILPVEKTSILDHRYYDPLRLPNAHLGFVRY